MQVVLIYLQPFRRNSVLKCALHPNIAKNSLKTSFWGVHGRSRSSLLINSKSLSPVLVMISSMYVLICNRFHVIRANNGKMTSFLGGTPLRRPRSRGTPAPSGTKFCHDKLETGGSPQWRFRDPSLHRFDTDHECDRRTDRRTDTQTMAKTREAFCFLAYKNIYRGNKQGKYRTQILQIFLTIKTLCSGRRTPVSQFLLQYWPSIHSGWMIFMLFKNQYATSC